MLWRHRFSGSFAGDRDRKWGGGAAEEWVCTWAGVAGFVDREG